MIQRCSEQITPTIPQVLLSIKVASKIYVYYGKIKLLFKNSLYEAKTSYSQLVPSSCVVCDCLAKVSGINKVFKNAKQPDNLVDCQLGGISYNTFSQVCRTDFHGIKYDIFSHFVKKTLRNSNTVIIMQSKYNIASQVISSI